jgi:hypothetical protein
MDEAPLQVLHDGAFAAADKDAEVTSCAQRRAMFAQLHNLFYAVEYAAKGLQDVESPVGLF